MNERIDKLAEQAGIKEELVVMFKGDKRAYVLSKDDVEKFAKLIVGKCLSIMDRHYEASIAYDEIKEYFGVEE